MKNMGRFSISTGSQDFVQQHEHHNLNDEKLHHQNSLDLAKQKGY